MCTYVIVEDRHQQTAFYISFKAPSFFDIYIAEYIALQTHIKQDWNTVTQKGKIILTRKTNLLNLDYEMALQHLLEIIHLYRHLAYHNKTRHSDHQSLSEYRQKKMSVLSLSVLCSFS